MKTTLPAVAAAAGLSALAGAANATDVTPGVVTVSCFRGPTDYVIWDHPNSVFIDSLIAVGYDFPTASALAERICRDAAGVNNPTLLKAETEEALREAPMWAHPKKY